MKYFFIFTGGQWLFFFLSRWQPSSQTGSVTAQRNSVAPKLIIMKKKKCVPTCLCSIADLLKEAHRPIFGSSPNGAPQLYPNYTWVIKKAQKVLQGPASTFINECSTHRSLKWNPKLNKKKCFKHKGCNNKKNFSKVTPFKKIT